MVKLLGSVINYFIVLYGVWANFPQILLRQSLVTVRRPALNEMSSGRKVIPSWARTRLMYLFFLGPYHNEKGTQMLPFFFHKSVHILGK